MNLKGHFAVIVVLDVFLIPHELWTFAKDRVPGSAVARTRAIYVQEHGVKSTTDLTRVSELINDIRFN